MNQKTRTRSILFDRVVDYDGLETAVDEGKIVVRRRAQEPPREHLPKVLASSVVLEELGILTATAARGYVRQLDDEVDP